MANAKSGTGGQSGKDGKAERGDRLAERLRDNLRKRKQQARSRASVDAGKETDPMHEDI